MIFPLWGEINPYMYREQSQSARCKRNGVLNREGGFQKKNNLHLSLFRIFACLIPMGKKDQHIND